MPRLLPPALALLPALLTASASAADTIDGRVVDSFGVGVAGVNIDAFDQQTGVEVDVQNDGTDAGGFFTADLPGPGVYMLVFHPPAPPVTTHLTGVLEDVVVVGSKALGDVALPPGVALSGRVLRPGGQPYAGLALELVDPASGETLITAGDVTDALGRFLVASPKAVELDLLPDPTVLPLVAPEALELALTGDTSLGDVQLEPGFTVELTAVRGGGLPVANADLDATDVATGEKRFTPHDNTDALGHGTLVVPAGTYDVEVCPKASEHLLVAVVAGVAVAANVDLGTVQLQAGLLLSGTVTDGLGMAVAGVDLDVEDPLTGADVPTCNDNTNAAGVYAVVVPAGTWNLQFTPRFADPYGTSLLPNVVVAADKTVNAVVPDCDCPARTGSAVAGSGGVRPRLSASGGCLRVGNPDLVVHLRHGLGGATALIAVGAVPAGVPGGIGGQLPMGGARFFGGGVVVLDGPAGVPGAGSAAVAAPLPDDPSLAGLTFLADAVVFDPGAPAGRARPRPLGGTFCE